MTAINYFPKSTLLEFHQSEAFIRVVCGSPGGGKTVAMLMEVMFLAMRQKPGSDGVRRLRAVIVRKTYARLKATARKTLVDWYPPECGEVSLSYPMEGLYNIPMPDGTTLHIEFMLLALDDENSLQALKSLEASVFLLNEVNELTREALSAMVERVGRYPSAITGALCTRPCVIADMNMVSRTHWLYDILVANPMQGVRFFLQQPAVFCDNYDEWMAMPGSDQTGGVFRVNPDAPNIENLPVNYYENMLRTYGKQDIASMLLLKWVSSQQGKLVFPEFLRKDHVGGVRTEPMKNDTVMIGIDTSGLNPAAVFGQVQGGTLVVLDECYGDGVAFEQFIQEVLLPLVARRYQGCELLALTDPSNPRDARTGVTPNQLLAQYKIRAQSASTNKFDLRRQAVSRLLNKRNGLVIDPACARLIEALEEGYVFKKIAGGSSTGGTLYSSAPEKNGYSHPADALQYLCLPLARTGDEMGGMEPGFRLKRRRFV